MKEIKKFFCILLSVFMLVSLMPAAFADDIAEGAEKTEKEEIISSVVGDGTIDNPYLISTEKELLAVSNDLGAYYELQNDIALTSNWTPLETFSGSFDGNGYTISGIDIANVSKYTDKGFFETNQGTIKNLTVHTTISTSDAWGHYGGLAANNSGIITNCHAVVDMSISCSCNVNHNIRVGGLVGKNNGGTISSSSVSGEIYTCGTGRFASPNTGGIAGWNFYDGTISSCYFSGTIEGGMTGGITGWNYELIERCYSDGSVTDNDSGGGGITGHNNGEIRYCYSGSSVQGADYAGGLVGLERGGSIYHCYAVGSVKSTSKAGALTGSSSENENITSSYYNSETCGCETGGVATPLTTKEMQTMSSYENWDFENIWNISPAVNNGYPYLRKTTTEDDNGNDGSDEGEGSDENNTETGGYIDGIEWNFNQSTGELIVSGGEMPDFTDVCPPWEDIKYEIRTVTVSTASIGSYAFANCHNLTLVNIRNINDITTIGSYAFENCHMLRTIYIPKSVETIGECAFANCDDGMDVHYEGASRQWRLIQIGGGNERLVDNSSIHYSSTLVISNIIFECTQYEYMVGDRSFNINVYEEDENGVLLPVFDDEYTVSGFDTSEAGTYDVTVTCRGYSQTFKITVVNRDGLTWRYNNETDELIIDGYGAMGEYDHWWVAGVGGYTAAPWDGYRSQIKKITIGDDVTSIAPGVFTCCKQLTAVNIGKSVESIGAFAFQYCEKLAEITIPDSVTFIGGRVFTNCYALENVNFGNGLAEIGGDAFYQCKLKNVVLPESLSELGVGVFSGCSELTEIYVPASIHLIGNRAFEDCAALTDVYYDGTEAEWSKVTIGEDNECLYNATIHYEDEPIEPEPEPEEKVVFENVKTEYYVGEEFYAEVYVYTAEGERYQVEAYEIEGFDSYTPGWQTVTVRYGQNSATYKVLVYEAYEPEPTEEVVIENVKTKYYIGEEFYAEVYVYATDGTRYQVDEFEVEGFNNQTVGRQKVTVRYNNYSETFTVTVSEREIIEPENIAKITVGDIKAFQGKEVQVTVDISDNMGFASLGIEIGYDSDIMTLINVTTNPYVGATFIPAEAYTVNPYNMIWKSKYNTTYNGTLATLTFLVNEDAPEGVYPITVDCYKGIDGNYDENFVPLGLSYVEGSITVKKKSSGGSILVESISFDISLGGDADVGTVWASTYDSSGKLNRVKKYPAAESVKVTLDVEDTDDYVKIMWWNEMEPMCRGRVIPLN